MAYIKLTLDHPLVDGESVTFKAPCDSTAVTGIKVYYPEISDTSETETNSVFTFKDTHGNSLTTLGNLFTTNAYVKVILDTTNNFAYIQNADTNGYLENQLASKYSSTNKPSPSDIGAANSTHASQHASTGIDPISPSDIGAAATSHNHSASDITSGTLPISFGGTGAETAAAAMSAISLITNNGYWNQALTGISAWKYEGADTKAYSLPYPHCFVLVMKQAANRGVAVAFRWNDGYNVQTWINHLHDTWRGWKLAVPATTHVQSGTPSNPFSGDLWAW